MVALSDRDRTRREILDPEFFRKNAAVADFQTLFFKKQLQDERIIAAVDEDGGKLRGFVIAAIIAAPPVYDPGGLTILIDDFTFNDQKGWNSVGLVLLEHVKLEGQARGGGGIVTSRVTADE